MDPNPSPPESGDTHGPSDLSSHDEATKADPITERFARIIEDDRAVREFMFAGRYVTTDSNAAANKARVVLEAVVAWLVSRHQRLSRLLKDQREGGLSKVLADPGFLASLGEGGKDWLRLMTDVVDYGNRGSHWKADKNCEVRPDGAKICADILEKLVEWFIKKGPEIRGLLEGSSSGESSEEAGRGAGKRRSKSRGSQPEPRPRTTWPVVVGAVAAVLAGSVAVLLIMSDNGTGRVPDGAPPRIDADGTQPGSAEVTTTTERDADAVPDAVAGSRMADASAAAVELPACTRYCSGPAGKTPLMRFEAGDGRVESAEDLRARVLATDPEWFTLIVGESGVGKTDLADWLRCAACREDIAVDFWDAADPARTADLFLAEHGNCGERPSVQEPDADHVGQGTIGRCVVVIIKFEAWNARERRLVLERLRTEVHPPGVNIVVSGRPSVADEVRRSLGEKPTAVLVPLECDETWAWLESELGGPEARQRFGEFLRTRQFPLDPAAGMPCPVLPWRTFRALLLLMESFKDGDGVFQGWRHVAEDQIREVVRIPEMDDPVAVVLDSIDPQDRFSPRRCQVAVQNRGLRSTITEATEVCARLADDPMIAWLMASPGSVDPNARAFIAVSRAVAVLSNGVDGGGCTNALAAAAPSRMPADQLRTFAAMAVTSPLGFSCPHELGATLCAGVSGDASLAIGLLDGVAGLSVPYAGSSAAVNAVQATGDAPPLVPSSGSVPEPCAERVAGILRGEPTPGADAGSSPTGLALGPTDGGGSSVLGPVDASPPASIDAVANLGAGSPESTDADTPQPSVSTPDGGSGQGPGDTTPPAGVGPIRCDALCGLVATTCEMPDALIDPCVWMCNRLADDLVQRARNLLDAGLCDDARAVLAGGGG